MALRGTAAMSYMCKQDVIFHEDHKLTTRSLSRATQFNAAGLSPKSLGFALSHKSIMQPYKGQSLIKAF